jgi:TPR repeat protein
MYHSGRGVPLDYVSAYAWCSRAAAAGDPTAAKALKQLNSIMTPRQKDLAEARLAESQSASISEQPAQSPFENARMNPK